MNTKQIQRYVTRYMEATQSDILEKSPYHIKVKLSPSADRELTNRPYYWSFVDRLNETPETMSFIFIFDEEKYEQYVAEQEAVAAQNEQLLEQKEVDRALGIVGKPIARMPKEYIHYGSSRLEQLFNSAQQNGGFVCMYEEPLIRNIGPLSSRPYTVWLGINYLIQFQSDRMREEIHSLGISLVTGYCKENFYEYVNELRLLPRIPANVHIAKNGITYPRALQIAEATIERKLKSYNYDWAEQAQKMLLEELERLDNFYRPLIEQAEEEQLEELQAVKQKRQEEIKWQYEPRVTVSVINCGLFHLDGID